MAFESAVLAASAARTTSGTSATAGSIGQTLSVWVSATAVSGTSPTLDLEVQWSADGGATWAPAQPADTFTQMTAVGSAVKQFAVKAPLYRLVWTIGGTTPSFTFQARSYSY